MKEIEEIIERNLTNLFDELDELAWHDGEYNPYIEIDALQALDDYSEDLMLAYTEHVNVGDRWAAAPTPAYWLDQDDDRWDVVDGGNLRLTQGPYSVTRPKEQVEAIWGPLTPGRESVFEVQEFDDVLYDLVFGQE